MCFLRAYTYYPNQLIFLLCLHCLQVIDENTSRTYWYNEHTGESLWTMPEDPLPTIPSVLAATLAADPPLTLRDVSVVSPVCVGFSTCARLDRLLCVFALAA